MILSSFFLAAADAQMTRSRNSPDFELPARYPAAETAIKKSEALSRAARHELFELYQRYIAAVGKRREQRWHSGLLSGEIVEHPEEPFIPARQLEESLAKRQEELKLLEERLRREKLAAAAVSPRLPKPASAEASLSDWAEPTDAREQAAASETAAAIKAKKKEVKRFRKVLNRAKGLSLDWSDAVWAELLSVEAEHWSVADLARTTQPRHTAAIACSPVSDPLLCLAFDPWMTGEPDVYEFRSWDDGSFEARVPPEYFLHRLPDTP